MRILFIVFGVFLNLVAARSEGIVFCYWGAWSIYRPDVGRFGVSDLPTDLCTHIVYTFIGLDAEGDLTHPEEIEIEGKNNYIEEFLKLKENNEDVKLLVAIGGWNQGSANFSIVSNNDTLRAHFVSNLMSYIAEQGFDGLDMDWEYPARNGGNETDKEAFIWLLRDLKTAFEPHGWLLTTAVGVTQYAIDVSYDVPRINEIVDYILLMSYDYHGAWDPVTGANAPLYPQLTDDPSSYLNVDTSVKAWISSGASQSKLVLGLAAYGRSFNLTNLNETSTGAPSDAAGLASTYTSEAGFSAYYEICMNQLNRVQEWSVTEVSGNYVYGNTGRFWIGYDNENTLYAKGQYAARNGMAGIMYWAVDLDDFSGFCSNNTYPLIRQGIEGFKNSASNTTLSLFILIILIFVTALFELLSS